MEVKILTTVAFSCFHTDGTYLPIFSGFLWESDELCIYFLLIVWSCS